MKSDNQLSQEPDPVADPGRGTTPEPPDEPFEHRTNPVPLAIGVVLLLVLGLRSGLPLVLMILGVIVMITIHELGHFLTAKWAGMKVTEFFVGFGPKLWSFHRGETEYGFKAIPAGAYVRIIGMNNLDEVAPEDEARAYRQQSFPKRLIVVLAGPATHAVQAFVILFVMFALIGVPGGELFPEDQARTDENWTVDAVTPESAAAAAGLEQGDRIVAFDGDAVRTWSDVQDEIGARDVGDEVTLTILRDASRFDSTTELVGRPESAGGDAGSTFLGVGPALSEQPDETVGPITAVGRSITGTGDVAWQSLVAMGSFFSPEGLGNYADTVSEGSGPSSGSTSGGASADDDGGGGDRMLSILGVVQLGSEAGENGLRNLLPIFLMINVFVGMINLVPLLPFDGGHAVVAIYERVRSRNGQRYHADVTKLLPVAYAVVMGLVILGVTSLYLDIVNPI
jgi:membrane-associated protease RseP (regulator of RpoE activity)